MQYVFSKTFTILQWKGMFFSNRGYSKKSKVAYLLVFRARLLIPQGQLLLHSVKCNHIIEWLSADFSHTGNEF